MACASDDFWSDSRLVPSYFCAMSLLSLLLTVTGRAIYVSGKEDEPVSAVQNSDGQLPHPGTLVAKIRQHVQSRGGATNVAFQVVRLSSTVALSVLSGFAVMLRNEPSAIKFSLSCPAWAELAMTIAYDYATLLCIFGILLGPQGRRLCNAHAASALLVLLGAFMYRNVLPLVFVDGVPADSDIPWLMWSRGALIALAGFVIPLLIPRVYVPVDPKNPASQPTPEQTASILSFLTFTFVESIVMNAWRDSDLPYTSLPPLSDYDWSSTLEKRSLEAMDPIIRRDKGLKNRHLFFGIMQVFFWEYVFFGFNLLLDVLSRFMAPFALNRLLRYMETGKDVSNVRPWAWIALLLLGGALATLFRNLYIFVGTRMEVQAENVLLQQIFRHALRLRVSDESTASESAPQSSAGSVMDPRQDGEASNASSTLVPTEASTANLVEYSAPGSAERIGADLPPPPTMHLSGRINTIIGADIGNILSARDFLVLIVMLPFQFVISVWFLYDILGWAAIVGMGFMIAMMPIPGLLAKRLNDVQTLKMQKTDARVQSITESMNIVRMIKMFGWEGMAKQRLSQLRKAELVVLRSEKLLQLFGAVLNNALPILILMVTFSFYTLVMHRNLDAATVFSSIAVLDLLRNDLGNVPWFIATAIQAKVSLDRLTKFLVESPMLDEYNDITSTQQRHLEPPPPHDNVIGLRNVNLSWADTSRVSAGGRRPFTLHVNDLIFEHGKVNLITGPTGCGKTSLLLALLGEMHVEPMDSLSWVALPRNDGVAYAAQESWVQNDTIQRNILFTEAYDEERYRKVLYQCALEPDLALLGAGDRTEVGEKGITLSGGQKARVTLARAIYSRAGILLLDDILSALDVHTAVWIVRKCLQGDLVQGRTVILATHAVDLILPISAQFVRLDMRGGITASSPAEILIAMPHESESLEHMPTKEADREEVQDSSHISEDAGKLTVDEEITKGRLKWTAVDLLIKAFGGYPIWMLILFSSFVVYLTSVFGTWWLGVWARAFETSPAGSVSISFYLGVFAALALFESAMYTVAYVIYLLSSLKASLSLHEALSEKVFGSTIRWLDVTPVGRVISRFTQDISTIDGPLATYLQMLVDFSLIMVIKFGAVIVFAPVFIVPGILLAVVGFFMGQIYVAARLPVRRLVSNWRSPLYTHFGASVEGLSSIRAYGAEDSFKEELFRRLDIYSRPSRTFHNLDRWISVRADMLGALFSSGLAIYLVYLHPGLGASNTGFSLNMAIGFSGLLLFWVRILNEVETSGNSVERIRDYLVIEQEPKPSEAGKPAAYWPASGSLRIDNLSARYSVDGPLVLKDLNFEIMPGERVGIVGRTGSGKSSLALSLLRLIPTTGDVYFDGRATRDINLDALRSHMAIIPQDPTLLSGTLRSNLDPFGNNDDAVLNGALRAVGLIGQSGGSNESGLSLETSVSSSGSNFSVGQRQLIALARALVRGTKVLILDEATASVDVDTDNLIQHSIRTELKETTLITIAHRLQTIMDYDKILVLDSGRLVEFGTPWSLLEKENGLFRGLVEESADRARLWEVAKKAAATA